MNDYKAKISEGADKAAQQVLGVVQTLQSTQHKLDTAVEDSHKADAALATQLMTTAAAASKEATGV